MKSYASRDEMERDIYRGVEGGPLGAAPIDTASRIKFLKGKMTAFAAGSGLDSDYREWKRELDVLEGRTPAEAGAPQGLPVNIEAEQELLGAVLANNEVAYPAVAGFLKVEHFADPRHGRIYAACAKLIDRGQVASPTTLKNYFEQDSTLTDIGGVIYLNRLMSKPFSALYAGDHGRLIADCWMRRQLIAKLEETLERVRDVDIDTTGADVALDLVGDIERLSGEGASRLLTGREVSESIVDNLQRDLPVVSTGFRCLDAMMGGGLFAERAFCIAARKKQGKTMIAGQISGQLSKDGVRHLFVCLESGPGLIAQRAMASAMGRNSLTFIDRDLRRDSGFVSKAANAAVTLPDACLYLDAPGLTFDRLRREVVNAVLAHKCQGFILDYLQLVQGQRKGQNKAEFLDDLAQWISEICRKRKIWALVLAQMNQEGNTRGGEGVRLAFDFSAELKRDQNGEGSGAWIQGLDSRWAPLMDAGSDTHPALILNKSVGPRFEEVQG